ncbi:hypothetical protein Gohar_024981, partial [Gossypium harknessii]|nr:hypothetical protein [Gossypium harknessii]
MLYSTTTSNPSNPNLTSKD